MNPFLKFALYLLLAWLLFHWLTGGQQEIVDNTYGLGSQEIHSP